MTLDPNARASWQGFLDLLRPPERYKLCAAIGTSFGVTFEALLAALLAMVDTDAETLRADAVAGVIAATRLCPRVRVLVHPGTIKSPLDSLSTPLLSMLDRVLINVPSPRGLFHPKLWLLHFSAVETPGERARDVVRLIVASRNLVQSRAFEAGIALEGQVTAQKYPLGSDVADALTAWTQHVDLRSPEVEQLIGSVRHVAFDPPHEGRDIVRLRWQGGGGSRLKDHLPKHFTRAVLISPFVRQDFVQALSRHDPDLRIVSTAEGLNNLDASTITKLQGETDDDPRLFVVGEHGSSDDAFIDGIHAKLLLLETPTGPVTYVGSANATGPGWGLSGGNTEAMLELKPGLSIAGFVKSFLIDQRKLRPWVRPFSRSDWEAPSDEQELNRRLDAELRRLGCAKFTVTYDATCSQLELSAVAESLPAFREVAPEIKLDVAPLCKGNADDRFRSVAELAAGLVFDDVTLPEVSAFVVMRARTGKTERTAITLGTLRMHDQDLELRDDAVRAHILSSARPEDVLRALVFGLARLRGQRERGTDQAGVGGSSERRVLEEVTLESLLNAVAQDRALIRELRLTMRAFPELSFSSLFDRVEAAAEAAYGESP